MQPAKCKNLKAWYFMLLVEWHVEKAKTTETEFLKNQAASESAEAGWVHVTLETEEGTFCYSAVAVTCVSCGATQSDASVHYSVDIASLKTSTPHWCVNNRSSWHGIRRGVCGDSVYYVLNFSVHLSCYWGHHKWNMQGTERNPSCSHSRGSLKSWFHRAGDMAQ